MRRTRIELIDIALRANLALAAWRAARGKRQRSEVAGFLANLDGELDRLAQEILDGRSPRGEFREFVITDPKRRLIHAACFADRVLHHAILNRAEATFERSLVDTSFACRPGLGVHAAIRHVQGLLRRGGWTVQVDVDGYFPAIDHERLLALLARRFKGAPFLDLMRRIIAPHPQPLSRRERGVANTGRGLPIGALTSQHCANLYLDGADRLLLAHPEIHGHCRYMDDILWLCDSREAARRTLAELRAWLAAERGLILKPDARIRRCEQGVTYCGLRILPHHLLLTPRKRRRYAAARAHLETAWARGEIDDATLQRGYDAVLAPTLQAGAAAWRRRELALHGSGYDAAG
jgi:hypothetical protein